MEEIPCANKDKEDWACCKCDDSTPFYQGKNANETDCRLCQTPKRLCHHMTMAVRAWKLQAGTLKPRDVTRDERKNRRDDNTNHPPPPPPVNSTHGGMTDLFHKLMAGEISNDQFNAAHKEHTEKTENIEVVDEPMGAASAEGPAAKADQRTEKQILADIIWNISKKVKLIKDLETQDDMEEATKRAKIILESLYERQRQALPHRVRTNRMDADIKNFKSQVSSANENNIRAQENADYWTAQVTVHTEESKTAKQKQTDIEEEKTSYII